MLGGVDPAELDPSQARDKGKGEKWAAMRQSGSIPEYVLDLHDKQAEPAGSPRKFKTVVINSLFIKSDKGRYTLSDRSPLFQEARKVCQREFAKDESRLSQRFS